MVPKNSQQQPRTSLQVYLGWARLQISFTAPNHKEFCMVMSRDHKICGSVHRKGENKWILVEIYASRFLVYSKLFMQPNKVISEKQIARSTTK